LLDLELKFVGPERTNAINWTGALCTPVHGQGKKKNFIVAHRFFFFFLIGYGK
jgi:hypothetical protein